MNSQNIIRVRFLYIANIFLFAIYKLQIYYYSPKNKFQPFSHERHFFPMNDIKNPFTQKIATFRLRFSISLFPKTHWLMFHQLRQISFFPQTFLYFVKDFHTFSLNGVIMISACNIF